MQLAGAQVRKADAGQGITHIVLNWPAQACDAPVQDTTSHADLRRQNWRLLLVDDQSERLAQLHAVVRRYWPAATLGQSDSGESALLQLEFAQYDLVLMALHMQSMDGLETVRRMRQHNKSDVRNVPVIGLSDKEFFHQRHRCKEVGMQWLVLRPVNGEQLAHIMEIHLPQEVQ